jgi:acetyltransferase-like isoleucine patch superfamily enzyme
VWIGTNAVIFPGVKIGGHTIVGSGAVEREDVPEWKIAAGLPM